MMKTLVDILGDCAYQEPAKYSLEYPENIIIIERIL